MTLDQQHVLYVMNDDLSVAINDLLLCRRRRKSRLASGALQTCCISKMLLTANQNKLSTEQAEVKRLSAANSAAQDNLSRAEAEVSRLTTALKSAQDSLTSIQADVSRLQPLADQAESLQSQVTSLQVFSG